MLKPKKIVFQNLDLQIASKCGSIMFKKYPVQRNMYTQYASNVHRPSLAPPSFSRAIRTSPLRDARCACATVTVLRTPVNDLDGNGDKCR